MKKHLATISAFSMALLSACSVFEPGEYMPIYLQEPSPLDPPGMEALRAEARAKYVKEGLYADGEQLEVQQGKAFLFNRNPDYYERATGRMAETATARIISCEGLYYFVEIDDGSKGFLRETDFVNPRKLVSSVAPQNELLPGAAPLPQVAEWSDEEAQDGAQRLLTTTSGRTVVVVSKKTEKSDEFEERLRKLKSTEPTPAADDSGLPTPTAELPEPAGSAE